MTPIKATHTDPECLTAAEEAKMFRREQIMGHIDLALTEVEELRESLIILLTLDGDAAYDYLQRRTPMVPYSKVAALDQLAYSLAEWRRALEESC